MFDGDKIIVGIGDGAEQSHYTREPFLSLMYKNNKKVYIGKSLRCFIQKECANWTGRELEECLGVDVYNKSFREPGNCWVLKGKPCPYFKKAVLPPVDYRYKHLCLVRNPNFEKKVRSQYAKIDSEVSKAEKTCIDCKVPIPKGKSQRCQHCRAARIRIQKRNWKRKNHN